MSVAFDRSVRDRSVFLSFVSLRSALSSLVPLKLECERSELRNFTEVSRAFSMKQFFRSVFSRFRPVSSYPERSSLFRYFFSNWLVDNFPLRVDYEGGIENTVFHELDVFRLHLPD